MKQNQNLYIQPALAIHWGRLLLWSWYQLSIVNSWLGNLSIWRSSRNVQRVTLLASRCTAKLKPRLAKRDNQRHRMSTLAAWLCNTPSYAFETLEGMESRPSSVSLPVSHWLRSKNTQFTHVIGHWYFFGGSFLNRMRSPKNLCSSFGDELLWFYLGSLLKFFPNFRSDFFGAPS
jgi:hypothetical protein